MKTYYTYWLHLPSHTNPTNEGYIGITTQKHKYRGRIAEHFRKLKNESHPNPKLQNAFNKHTDLSVVILCEGMLLYCTTLEHKLRPQRNIG